MTDQVPGFLQGLFFVLVDEAGRQLDVRPVDKQRWVVGRTVASDIVIRSGRILKEHLVMVFQPDGPVTLTHKASFGANVVNGKNLSSTMTCTTDADVRIRMWEHVLFITRDPQRVCAEMQARWRT